MKSVVVTGGSGKAGRAAIRELLDHGYQVMNVDTVAPTVAPAPSDLAIRSAGGRAGSPASTWASP